MPARVRLTNESHLKGQFCESTRLVCARGANCRTDDANDGTGDLLDGFLLKLSYFTHIESSPAYYLVFGVANLVGGLCLILGAPVVARFAYPREDEDQDEGNVDQD